jgi:predicted DCC family thiol-disulfide oxidoreductase YuxK
LVALGLFTQVALIFLVLLMWQIGEQITGTSTLGNDVAAMVAICLFLVNSGKYLSLDSALIKIKPHIRAWLGYFRGDPSSEQIFWAKIIALTSYWAVCIYSVSMHLAEPAWMDGSAGPYLLSNNFMSRYFEEFEALVTSFPWTINAARASLWAMIFWYPAVLPFVLMGGVARRYVIVWGWLFFALSMFVLQLGWLAEIEVVLWLLLFWSSVGLNPNRKIEVFYDDRCNLCDRTVQLITLLDIFSLVVLKPVSKNGKLLQEYGISTDAAMTDLYGVRDGGTKLFSGYNFYVELSKTLVLLWPALPLLLIGRVLTIGPRIYRAIATRRRELFGICALPRRKFDADPEGSRQISSSLSARAVAISVSLLLFCYFVATPAPYLGWYGKENLGYRAAHIFGITPIDVFNKDDLRMAENWFTLYSDDFRELVPVLAEDGSRLSMHDSDRMYFGYTLSFRRRAIGSEGCIFKRNFEDVARHVARVFLHSMDASAGIYTFTYRQYFKKLPDLKKLKAGQYQLERPRLRCEVQFTVDA